MFIDIQGHTLPPVAGGGDCSSIFFMNVNDCTLLKFYVSNVCFIERC